MTITLRLFARAKEAVGAPTVEMELGDGSTIADLRRAIVREHSTLETLAPHLLFARGTDYVTDETTVSDRDEIAVFPPVSGG